MSGDNVAIRLKLFISHLGLSFSQFADECGIPRPSLSQLLTGRNKKISDILVGQIHHAFPQLSVLWLLFGEGEMLVASRENPENREDLGDDISFTTDPDENFGENGQEVMNSDLFNPIFVDKTIGGNENAKETALSPSQNVAKHADIELTAAKNQLRQLQQQIDQIRKNPRKVVQITIYYDDSTFETFFPDK